MPLEGVTEALFIQGSVSNVKLCTFSLLNLLKKKQITFKQDKNTYYYTQFFFFFILAFWFLCCLIQEAISLGSISILYLKRLGQSQSLMPKIPLWSKWKFLEESPTIKKTPCHIQPPKKPIIGLL